MVLSDTFQLLSQRLNLASEKVLHSHGGTFFLGLAAAIVLLVLAGRLYRYIATLHAMALTPLASRILSKWVRTYFYTEDEFLRADGAPTRWTEVRRAGLERLANVLRQGASRSIAWSATLREGFSDLRFTDANRVPFPFMGVMREKFALASVVTESRGPHLRNLDDQVTLDISGSYGLNVAGFDQYKLWIERGWERVRDLGPVLGPLHPIVAENITLLKSISKLDEVSFHMSGTEAVMAAVRLARFNTRKSLIVCFAGAYHGWWDGVQPGLGNERSIGDCLTLKDMNPSSLRAIRASAGQIAAVLVNPVQAFHPNSPPPSDQLLLTSKIRRTHDSTSDYAKWLQALRRVCTESDIPLIFDEVYSGFRLAPGGAQEYYGVNADMVVYGKTVAGGMPIGLVCGKQALMQRFDPERPMRVAYVVGTFSAHPLVMGAMNEFLRWVNTPAAARMYEDANRRCSEWVRATNARLAAESLPIQVMNLSTVWTVLFKEPGRFNWLLQYYMRSEGLTLSWVGTGRCLASLDYTPDDYQELQDKLIAAVRRMKSDAWWLSEQQLPERERAMRRNLIREVAASLIRVPRPLAEFYSEIMQRKHDDHEASHSNLVNQFFHLLSSSTFIACYVWAFFDLTSAMCAGLAALFVRQFGHAILEPPCHDKEKALLGFNTRDKSFVVAGYFLIPIAYLAKADSLAAGTLHVMVPTVARLWFLLTLAVIVAHVALLVWKYDLRSSMIWLVKLVTDPFTDIIAYRSSPSRLWQAVHGAEKKWA
ncbi:MAG TPA: aminotransferase class III-fold pyridoxal phosphate-dependent enzyme [Candidatus Binataceae bacterium]